LLQYICGLGPRKATSVLKAINANVSIQGIHMVRKLTNYHRVVSLHEETNLLEILKTISCRLLVHECTTTVPVFYSSIMTVLSKIQTT
jgi:hypothetical protein